MNGDNSDYLDGEDESVDKEEKWGYSHLAYDKASTDEEKENPGHYRQRLEYESQLMTDRGESFFDFEVRGLYGHEVDLRELCHGAKVILVVNVASK